MATLVSEVKEGGDVEIVETSGDSNYQMQLNRLDGKLPTPPSPDALTKIFKPRFVLEVTADDGTVIPFVYKRIDPATLIMTHGSPVSIDTDVAKTADNMAERLKGLVGDRDDVDVKSLSDDDATELRELLRDPKAKQMVDTYQTLHKNVVQSGVISPEITDDLYEHLDDDVLDALYEAITGGVTSQNELVQHFR